MDREVVRERVRASRRGIPFCIVSVTLLTPKSKASRQVARLLLRNLRQTDHKGMFGLAEFAILLTDTPHAAGASVVHRLQSLFSEKGLFVRLELKVHEPPNYDPPSDDEGWNRQDSRRQNRSERNLQPQDCADQDREELGTGVEVAELDHVGSANEDRSSERRELVSRSTSSAFDGIDGYVSSEDPLIEVQSFSRLIKRGLDIAISGTALVALSPILGAAILAVRWTSPGPAIFKQTREGYRGRPFTIYKLRTMVQNAEAAQDQLRKLSHRDGPAFKIANDPRVTAVGRFLRASCIDELPQLVNVLKGDMSIVGPRPLPWHESRSCAHWHRRRLDVLPGLTCSWQIDKSRAETFDDWMRLDLEYVDNRNFWSDLGLICRTFSVALLGKGSQ